MRGRDVMVTFPALADAMAFGGDLTLADGLAASVSTERPAAATGITVPVHEFNMCSRKCRFNPGDPADLVNYLVTAANPRPWVIM